jgi:hypothetical protein
VHLSYCAPAVARGTRALSAAHSSSATAAPMPAPLTCMAVWLLGFLSVGWAVCMGKRSGKNQLAAAGAKPMSDDSVSSHWQPALWTLLRAPEHTTQRQQQPIYLGVLQWLRSGGVYT